MEITENVCEVENGTKTEYTDAVSVGEREDSTVLGKFKDANALLKAYESLQAEFTRRSQRLKEMERELRHATENRGETSAQKVEKLKKGAQERKRREREFDSFVESLENSASFGLEKSADLEKEIGQVFDESAGPVADCGEKPNVPPVEKMPKNGVLDDGETVEATETAAPNATESVKENGVGEFVKNKNLEVSRGETALGDYAFNDAETLYRLVNNNENVRLRVVGDYLRSVGRPDAPIMKGGVGTLAAPVKKATSIGEAGRMALRYLKKDGQA